MLWRRAEKQDLNSVARFLQHQESRCVSFAWRLRLKQKHNLRWGPQDTILFRNGGRGIDGAVFVSSAGLLYPVFADGSGEQYKAMGNLREEILKAVSVPVMIMGPAKPSEALNIHLRGKSVRDMHYKLLEKTTCYQKRPALSDSLKIRKALPRHLHHLLNLQIGYEQEEVLASPDLIDKEMTEQMLRLNLKQQLVYGGFIGGKAVSKAQTNAIGYNYAQIGGVYTAPEYRRKGYSAAVMDALLDRLEKDHLKTALFVQNGNIPALRLYRNLGFEQIDDFRIIYYR